MDKYLVIFGCTYLRQTSFYIKEISCIDNWRPYPDNKVHGANMGLIWGRQDPGGPHVGPMNLAVWVVGALQANRLCIGCNHRYRAISIQQGMSPWWSLLEPVS